MIIECPTCEAKVHAKILKERVYPPDDDLKPHKYMFLECPECENVLLGYFEYGYVDPGGEEGGSEATRVWPKPHKSFPNSVPRIIRVSLEDAQKCFQAKVYTASTVMCGRALEAICIEKAGEKKLSEGLKELKDLNIIDERLYAWGDALRKQRNMGAQASEETVEREDAQDVLDFAIAIVDYIYVLSEKFRSYQERKIF